MMPSNQIHTFLLVATIMAKNAAPFTVKRDLNFLDSRVLSHLKAFDLNGCILSQEPFVVGMGSYSDVYKAKCFIGGRGEVNSAMKRLRMHVKLDKGSCKQVRPLLNILSYRFATANNV